MNTFKTMPVRRYTGLSNKGFFVEESETSKIEKCFIAFGVIVGIVGILHGSAELLQGSALVESRSISALPGNWPNNGFYSMTQGSPVFSILTDIPFYVLGILAISVSTTLIVLSATVFKKGKLGVGLLLSP